MFGIPLVNSVAIIHLVFICVYLGLYITEMAMEVGAYYVLPDNEPFHHSVIKLHFWIDNILEIPLITGIIVSGTCLLFLIDSITYLHIIKISFAATAFGIGGYFCYKNVIMRYIYLGKNKEHKELKIYSKIIVYSVLFFFNIFLISTGILGVYLGYCRIISSIYG